METRGPHSRRFRCRWRTLRNRSRGRRRCCMSCCRRCGSFSSIPCQGNGAAEAATRCARRSRRSRCRTRSRRRGRRRRTRRRRSTSSCRCKCRHARGLGWPPAVAAVGLGRSRRSRCPTGHSGTRRRPGCQCQRGCPPADGAALSARAGSSPRSRCSTRAAETRSRERRRCRNRPHRPPRRTRKRPYSVTAGEAKWRRGRADGAPGPKAPQPHQRKYRSCSRRARPGRRRRLERFCKRRVAFDKASCVRVSRLFRAQRRRLQLLCER